jgi:ABC-2 type transport system permease protein
MVKIEWTANIKKTFNRIIKSRTFKYGANSIVLIAAVVAIAVVLNILVGLAGVKWDLTPNKLYSIGDTTKNILAELDKDVIIYGLFDETRLSPSSADREFVDLLDQYGKYPHVEVKYVDPDKNPGILKEIDPNDTLEDVSKSVFIVKSGNKLRSLSYYDLFSTYFDQSTFETKITGSAAESGFTGAIKYVTADYTPTIYFTTGHDEKDIDRNFSYLKEQLINNNFDIKPINLLIEGEMPEDAEILVVASPQKDLTTGERDKIKEYLKDGGKAIFMFDYLELNPQFTQFENVLMDFNIGINYDKVKEKDESRHWPPP